MRLEIEYPLLYNIIHVKLLTQLHLYNISTSVSNLNDIHYLYYIMYIHIFTSWGQDDCSSLLHSLDRQHHSLSVVC